MLVASSRTTGGKPLTYIPQAAASAGGGGGPASPASASSLSSANASSSPSLQRSLTSAAASKMKKALGLRSSASSKGGSPGSGGGGKSVPPRRPATVGELMRVQMRVSEPADARIRRGLLRIAASQVNERISSSLGFGWFWLLARSFPAGFRVKNVASSFSHLIIAIVVDLGWVSWEGSREFQISLKIPSFLVFLFLFPRIFS